MCQSGFTGENIRAFVGKLVNPRACLSPSYFLGLFIKPIIIAPSSGLKSTDIKKPRAKGSPLFSAYLPTKKQKSK